MSEILTQLKLNTNLTKNKPINDADYRSTNPKLRELAKPSHTKFHNPSPSPL